MPRFTRVFALLLAMSGCTQAVAVQLRHPMRTGFVDPNRVPHQYAAAEDSSGLPPGSLTDEASLVRMDPQGICFDVTMRNLQENASTTDLTAYDIRLTTSAGVEVRPAQVLLKQPTARTLMGRVPVQQETGSTTACVETDPDTRECRRWETRPVYSTVYVPGPVTVVQGGAQVCFANGGTVTAATEQIALELGRGVGSLNFEWEFGPGGPPSAPQAPPAPR